ncbi:enolase C-terminal domain-like protein [Mediterraneibacter agrestimuris]|uniref:enolase C-terminal domain-like protein n=1 Tax=Mediterraneibacter agrestimuris TaxID=2941333 RepID=UPI00203FDC11|nr:enolase C-terminal domain-like protein [Mediterraneibacter agrestimuris]
MKITDVRVIRFKKDTWLGSDKDGHMHPCKKRDSSVSLVEIETDEGIVGQYLSADIWQTPSKVFDESAVEDDTLVNYELAGTGHFLSAAINKLKPILIGEDPMCREKIFTKIFRMQRIGGAIPIGDEVVRVVDTALWDLFGKAVKLPIYKILGGHRTRIPAYGSIMVGDDIPSGLDTPEAYGSYAKKLVKRGYRGIKLHTWMDEKWADNKISGLPDIERDLDACRAVREAVGDDVPLFLDPFHNYTREQALYIGRELEKLNFEWMEEPMDEYDIEAYRWLTSKLPGLSVCGPETAHGKGQTRAEWIRSKACDIVRAGLTDVGGITPFMKIVHLCELNGMPLEVHAGGADTIQVLAAMGIPGKYYERGLLHPFLEYDTIPPWLLEAADYMDDEGYIHVPERPGCGYMLNWDYINQNIIK